MKYLFKLGHQPHISIAELKTVFLSKKPFNIATKKQGEDNYVILEIDEIKNPKDLIVQLGGTIKIGQLIKPTGDIVKSVVSFLNKNNTGKIHFSVPDKKLGLAIKKELKTIGRSVRYIEPKNAATILHNNLVVRQGDFTIVDKDTFVTIALQPFEEMSQRDYDRPGSDDKSGMLPPKLAKIMLNLSGINHKQTLLDPFCGSGTILTEALAMGFTNIIGSDISDKAINDSQKNIEWLIQNYELRIKNYELINSDAKKLTEHLKPNSIDTIVSEPYMGKPLRGNENKITLQKQAQELAKLYTEAFKSFYKILKKNGVVVFVIPQFKLVASSSNQFQDDWIKIDCIEKIKDIGFSLELFDGEESLLYHRTKQHLGRGIYRFKKQ